MKTKFHVLVNVFREEGVVVEDFYVNAKSEYTLKRHLGYRYGDARYDIASIVRVPDAQMSLF